MLNRAEVCNTLAQVKLLIKIQAFNEKEIATHISNLGPNLTAVKSKISSSSGGTRSKHRKIAWVYTSETGKNNGKYWLHNFKNLQHVGYAENILKWKM